MYIFDIDWQGEDPGWAIKFEISFLGEDSSILMGVVNCQSIKTYFPQIFKKFHSKVLLNLYKSNNLLFSRATLAKYEKISSKSDFDCIPV